VIISSGCGRLFVIIGPPFPKHSAGPVQMGRLIGIQLLTDMRHAVSEDTKPEWTSTDLYNEVVYNDENDWTRFDHGREITKKKFTRLLSEFGVTPKKKQKANVFYVSDLEEAFKRYLPPM